MTRAPGQSGFSLIELVVVMAILTVLAGAAVPVVSKGLTRARVQETRRELDELAPALTAYFEDTGRFPPTFDDLERDGADVPGWTGPYLRARVGTSAGTSASLEQDAWDQPYSIGLVDGTALTVTSPGIDGRLGTEDDLALALDVTPVLRRRTLAELALLNQAVAAYNATHLPAAPLPRAMDDLLEALVEADLLPAGLDGLDTDAWGDAYRPDPPDQDPVVILQSQNLSPAEE